MARASWGAVAAVLVACSGGTPPASGDAGAGVDATIDASVRDAARDATGGGPDAAPDGGITDAGGPLPPELWFEDVTLTAGVDLVRTPADGYGTLPDRMSGGVCVLDVDGEPPVDLFFAVRPADDGTRSRLYVGRDVLDYADETDARGLSDVGDAMGCLAFDADADGDDDLLVTGLGGLRLFHHEGGTFVDRSERLDVELDPRTMYMSAAAGDVDGDGDLDLAVAGFIRFDPGRFEDDEMCGPVLCTADVNAYPYAPDLLLEQRSDGTFVNATAAAPDLLRAEPGLVVAIRDLTGDRAADIYVGNDLGHSFYDRVLHRTGSGAFVDVAPSLGLAHDFRGYGIDTMGFASGDLNGDGHLEFAATSFETDPTAVFARQPDGTYADIALSVGTPALAETFRWGVALVDLDLDGDVDLFEATGHFHSDAEIETIGYVRPRDQRPNLMVNLGDGTLRAITPAEGDGLRVERSARGIAVTDLDDDGRPDIVLAPADGPAALLRNVREPTGHWLRVRLVGNPPNTAAAGARVTVRTGGRTHVRERVLGEGYLGSFDPRLFFGLAGADPVDVEVRWPSGERTTLTGISVDRDLVLEEP